MRPAGRPSGSTPAGKGKRPPRDATDDYRDKTAHEISRLSRRMKENGHPAPLGDPASGIVLVLEQPVGPRVLEALKLSLEAVGLPEAYVTYAATDIDATGYPLVRQPFSEAEPGVWFSWTRGTPGLLVPSLTPALEDEAAKRRFWKTFLGLKVLAPS